MTNEQPIFTCPHCSENLFDVGITEFVSNANISTMIDFKQGHLNAHETQLEGPNDGKQIQCRSCKNVIDMDSDQLDAVFSGRNTEEEMKVRCRIIPRPIFRCPKCKTDVFKSGIHKITTGSNTSTEITFCSDGIDYYIDPSDIKEIKNQWSECGKCSAQIDINASDLINYYEGECSLEDIISE